ncbi:DegT/DnrJ/EryC1/StrS aminotransferase family protein [Treponema sp. OMZ 840]|uniref:DegT/DnrJ/EryC1/StrS family aminotransferase n=1 Tax=Treponema sp. OMZ 840 TaxID=244313 RepID=UPI003D8B5BD8
MAIETFSPTIRRKEMDAVLTCMVEEKLGPGELNGRLIQQVKESFGFSGGFAVRSPAIALKYALRALGLEAGSSVMISALAPAWQYTAVTESGFNCIILDVSNETGLIIPETAEKGIKDGGRVLLLHETLGQLPNFSALNELGVPIIEDISQNAGAVIGDKSAGTFGTFAILGLEERDILTAGGGAVLAAAQNRNWSVLRKLAEQAPSTDLLPDINAALGYVQLKELARNEQIRKEIYEMYIRALMQGRHKTYSSQIEYAVPAVYSFPVILSGSFKDVKQYAAKKDIAVQPAYEHAVISVFNDLCSHCTQANSLFLRCALFPLYPRLGSAKAQKIAKVLATLP